MRRLGGAHCATAGAGFYVQVSSDVGVHRLIGAHRFLFGDLRVHLLGWPAFLAPAGRIAALPSVLPPV